MKLVKILTISFCIIMISTQSVFALGDIFSKADSWEVSGLDHADETLDYWALKEGSDILYNILLAVATAVAIIVGAILGIQYMTAGIDKKVEVKQSLFPYIISCVVVFGSFGIWKLVVEIMSDI